MKSPSEIKLRPSDEEINEYHNRRARKKSNSHYKNKYINFFSMPPWKHLFFLLTILCAISGFVYWYFFKSADDADNIAAAPNPIDAKVLERPERIAVGAEEGGDQLMMEGRLAFVHLHPFYRHRLRLLFIGDCLSYDEAVETNVSGRLLNDGFAEYDVELFGPSQLLSQKSDRTWEFIRIHLRIRAAFESEVTYTVFIPRAQIAFSPPNTRPPLVRFQEMTEAHIPLLAEFQSGLLSQLAHCISGRFGVYDWE